jgi:hypothetical protein
MLELDHEDRRRVRHHRHHRPMGDLGNLANKLDHLTALTWDLGYPDTSPRQRVWALEWVIDNAPNLADYAHRSLPAARRTLAVNDGTPPPDHTPPPVSPNEMVSIVNRARGLVRTADRIDPATAIPADAITVDWLCEQLADIQHEVTTAIGTLHTHLDPDHNPHDYFGLDLDADTTTIGSESH